MLEILVALAFCVLLIGCSWLALRGLRRYERLADEAQRKLFEALVIHTDPEPGDVVLIYHTYEGLLVWLRQKTYRAWLPPDQARLLLGRLFRFNMRWGCLSYGAIFIPPISFLNYVAQRRSITRQERALATAGPNTYPLPSMSSAVGGSRSIFHRLVGWICMGLCVLFGVVAAVGFANGEYETAIGGLIATAVFGLVARNWIRGRYR